MVTAGHGTCKKNTESIGTLKLAFKAEWGSRHGVFRKPSDQRQFLKLPKLFVFLRLMKPLFIRQLQEINTKLRHKNFAL